jgi:hypothetical protein
VALCCEHGGLDAEGLHRELGAGGALARLGPVLTGEAVAGINAPREEVLDLWRHALAMHRKTVELPRELDAVAREFATAFTEENFRRLQDLHAQRYRADDGVETPPATTGRVDAASAR